MRLNRYVLIALVDIKTQDTVDRTIKNLYILYKFIQDRKAVPQMNSEGQSK